MKPRISQLSNGMTVATDLMPHLETAAIGVWVSVGARHEDISVHGVSHFLEHMAFKGTKERSALQIVEEIEQVGGYLNAYTSREQTAYYARILKADRTLALDILSDILLNSTFEEAEMERERGVIVQEIGQYADNPEDVIFEHFQATAFPEQAMGRPILGTIDSVRGMSSDNLRQYVNKHYGANEMWLVAAGAIDHDRLVEEAEAAFADLNPITDRYQPEKAAWGGGSHVVKKDLEQAHVMLGLPGVSVHDDDFYTAQVVSEILGGSMSSRLFQEVREKRGLCYSIYTFKSAFDDSGLFGIYAGTGGESVAELVPVIIGEIEKLSDSVDDAEIARAQAQAKAGILMGLESAHSRCEWIARHLPRYGRVKPASELVESIEAVDANAVKAFASRLMESKSPVLAGLGPIDGLESYHHFAARFAG